VVSSRAADGRVETGALDVCQHPVEGFGLARRRPERRPDGTGGRAVEQRGPRRRRYGRRGDHRRVDDACRNGAVREAEKLAHRIDDHGRDARGPRHPLGEDAERVGLPVTALADDQRRVWPVEVEADRSTLAAVGGAVGSQTGGRPVVRRTVASEDVHGRGWAPLPG